VAAWVTARRRVEGRKREDLVVGGRLKLKAGWLDVRLEVVSCN
jgi:hypothetical protein